MRAVVITGVFSVLAAGIGAIGATAYTNKAISANENNNTINVAIDGSNQTVTPDKYIALYEKNAELEKKFGDLQASYNKLSEELEAEKKGQAALPAIANSTEAETSNSDVSYNSSSAVKLKDLAVVNSVRYEEREAFTDTYGNQYEIGHEFRALDDGYAVFGLQGKYTDFVGHVVAGPKTGSNAHAKLMVYVDDELIDTISSITKTTEMLKIGPYNIKDARKLELKFLKEKGDGCYFYLVDSHVE